MEHIESEFQSSLISQLLSSNQSEICYLILLVKSSKSSHGNFFKPKLPKLAEMNILPGSTDFKKVRALSSINGTFSCFALQ